MTPSLDDVAASTSAAEIHRERTVRYLQDRESRPAWLRQLTAPMVQLADIVARRVKANLPQ